MLPSHSDALRVYGRDFSRFPPRLGLPAQSLNLTRTVPTNHIGTDEGGTNTTAKAHLSTFSRPYSKPWFGGSAQCTRIGLKGLVSQEVRRRITPRITTTEPRTTSVISNMQPSPTLAPRPDVMEPLEHPSPDRSKERPSSSPSTPPHSFIIFGLTYLRTQYEAETVQLGEAGVYAVISDAWNLISPEDRAKIEGDSERAEELHMAMLQRCWETRIKGPEVSGRNKTAGTSRGE
ncbi:hypothetical protein FA13DRAFT_1732634 [Coprinellus micaceus]|uniref:HMG box domain-containing protein n=1 Tax=Coprinellus micaceus TaxID=71717 RepID=A0A4Y7TC47_COPMI|nr:hypothetical protein FA13DRAFT_1732634 [Coprinellus micaceus]